jgi:hypothetical protein
MTHLGPMECMYIFIYVCMYLWRFILHCSLNFIPAHKQSYGKTEHALSIVLWIIHQTQIWAILVFSYFMQGPWHQKFLLDCFWNPVCSWPGNHNLISTSWKLQISLSNLWNAVLSNKSVLTPWCVYSTKNITQSVKIQYMSNSSQIILIFSCAGGVISNSHVCRLCTSSTFLNLQYPFKISVHFSKFKLPSTVLCIWNLWNL